MNEVTYTINDSGKYVCSCGEFTGSRSGWYKHKAVKHSPLKEEAETITESVEVEEESTPVEESETTSWMDFGMDVEDDATTHMPKPLKALKKKAIAKGRGKMSKAEIQSLRDTSKAITTMFLTFGDTAMSVWGRGVLIDPDFRVAHSDRDKELTADAVVGAMEEKGMYIANSISQTAIATAMVGWYFGVPTYQITKKAKKGLFKGGRGSGLLSRIPLIGRLFRRKKRQVQIPVEGDVKVE